MLAFLSSCLAVSVLWVNLVWSSFYCCHSYPHCPTGLNCHYQWVVIALLEWELKSQKLFLRITASSLDLKMSLLTCTTEGIALSTFASSLWMDHPCSFWVPVQYVVSRGFSLFSSLHLREVMKHPWKYSSSDSLQSSGLTDWGVFMKCIRRQCVIVGISERVPTYGWLWCHQTRWSHGTTAEYVLPHWLQQF